MMTLSKAEFVDALKKGKGRALQHLRVHGDAGLEDALLNASIHCLAYDPQSEGDRGGWMMEMLSFCRDPETYYRAVLAHFPESDDGHDIAQMAAMLVILAQRGYPGARDLLYAKLDRQYLGGSDTAGQHIVHFDGQDIVDLDGIDGFLHVAEVIGRRMQSDADFRADDYLLTAAGEKHGADNVAAALQRAAKTNSNVSAYVDAIMAQSGSLIPKAKANAAPTRERISLAAFLDAPLDAKSKRRSMRWQFARQATADELTSLLQLIAEETDSTRLHHYLGVFNKVDMPELSPPILELARSDDGETRDLAISALARLTDDRVRSLAVELLDQGVLKAIELFAKNYVDGDFDRIAAKLGAPDDDRQIHDIGLDLLGVCRDHPVPASAECLIWIYEHTPCAFCRNSAVDDLLAIDRLPAALALECQQDCYSDTREAVAKAS